MSILNKSDKKVRESLLNTVAILEYQLAGGKITVCKPQRNKVSRKVRIKEDLFIQSSIPKNRPAGMFDNISERKLNGIWNNW